VPDTKPEPLADLERDVLDYIIAYLRRNTFQPSIREIGRKFDIPSTRKVSEILKSLETKGWVERTRSRSRGVRVLGFTREPPPGPPESARFDEAVSGDEGWMARALGQAVAAVAAEEVPVGAVLVRGGELVASACNLTRTLADPTAHAEMIVLRSAAAQAGQQWLSDSTLYVTLEPCAMCAGAIVLARIERLVYAAADPKTGMCGSLGCIVQDPRLNHRVQVTRGVREAEAAELLRSFFLARR
jgi:tRNA(adenine34) deaminase